VWRSSAEMIELKFDKEAVFNLLLKEPLVRLATWNALFF
jgi:hypothetical protein